jgi:hypothetical protein
LDNFNQKKCKNKECGKIFKQYNSLQSYCSLACKSKCKPPDLKLKSLYKIPKVSDKRKALMPIYEKVRIEVLVEANFKCFIEGCTNVANTIEHTAGRKGFYDQWARDNNISLLVDKRFLKACCLFHNGELENNPKLSKEYQLSKIHGGKKL